MEAWVPPVPPSTGMSIAISHPKEAYSDGVVRYRVMSHFNPAVLAFPPASMKAAPVPESQVCERVVTTCNDVLVIRRFSEFDSVFKEMSSVKGLAKPLPPLPEKKLFGNKDPKFVEQRRASIEAFANAILEHPQLAASPAFHNLIGFSNLQLWYALSDKDDVVPPVATLKTSLSIDGEVLRSDAIQRSTTAKHDAVRRCIGRLLYFSLGSDAGLRTFVYENARMALVHVADRAVGESTMFWLARAVHSYATVDESSLNLVARGDVRDALLKMANRSWAPPTMAAVSEAVSAIVLKGNPGARQLFLSAAAVATFAAYFARDADIASNVRLLEALAVLADTLPTFKYLDQQLFSSASALHAGLGAVRDRLGAGADEKAAEALRVAMEKVACASDVAAAPMPQPPADYVDRQKEASATAASLATASVAAAAPAGATGGGGGGGAVDDFLDDNDDGDGNVDHFGGAGAEDGGGVDDFLDGSDDDGAGVDDFLASDDEAGDKPAAGGGGGGIDDFLDDD